MNVTILIGTYSHEGVNSVSYISIRFCKSLQLTDVKCKMSQFSVIYAIPVNELSLQEVVFNKAFQVDHPKVLAASQGSIKYAIVIYVYGL